MTPVAISTPVVRQTRVRRRKYSAISTGVTVRHAEVEHSILLEDSRVEDLDARVESSLIGRGVTIARTVEKPRAYRFMVGDSSSIGLV